MSAAFGELRVFTQENGSEVRLRVFGDEFYARRETTDGYTCLYDTKLGLYCYATLSDGSFKSTGIPISIPPLLSEQLHLKETPDVRNAQFNSCFADLRRFRPIGTAETGFEIYGPNEGLLEGRQLNKGQICGLAILVDFQDVQTTITRDEVSALLNVENYTTNGNYCSVREYYRLMSSGMLDYSNVVVGPVRLSQKRRYYVDHLLAEETLNLVSESGLDLSQFDSSGIGAIDAVSFLYAGETIWEGSLWPHNSTLKWHSGGYRAGMYQITGLGITNRDLVIGTFCHESGHMLCRFPDLYDYGKQDGDFESSAGLGSYCLMSAGNHLNGGRTPAPICAYLRDLAGWCPNRISLNEPGVQQAIHGAYDTVFVYQTSQSTEYFLIENRSKFGLDEHLPANGLAVYHCDTKGSNERQGGTAEQHYQCSLLQADGRLDLERNVNRGDADDFFILVKGEALSDTTNPSTKMWDGSDSGLRISDISTADKTITFLIPPGRNIMNGSVSSGDTDPEALKRLQEQTKILQANLDFYKLTQQQEQERLKAEIDRVKLEAEKQKAEADKIKALLPTGTTKPLSGETKVDEKFGYLAKLAAHNAAENAAKEIAEQVEKVIGISKSRIVLVDTLDFCGDDIQLFQITDQMGTLKKAITDQIAEVERQLNSIKLERQTSEEAFVAAASVLPMLGQVLSNAPGMISWAADIAAYFQAEDTYKSVDVTMPLTALQSCFAKEMKVKKPAITACFPNFHTFSTFTDLPLLKDFGECTINRHKLSTLAAQLKIAIETVTKAQDKNLSSEIAARLKVAEASHTTAQSLIQAFDDFSKAMAAIPEGKNYSPLARAAMRMYLKKGEGQNSADPTYLLYLNIVSSGGEVSIRRWLWWMRRIVFLGGCVVTYVLADLAGNTLASGTLGKLTRTKYARWQKAPIQFENLTAP